RARTGSPSSASTASFTTQAKHQSLATASRDDLDRSTQTLSLLLGSRPMQDGRERQSDNELVETCNHGGARDAAAAFAVLYRRHRDFVLRVALRFVAERELAHDALQETFTHLLRQFPPTGRG